MKKDFFAQFTPDQMLKGYIKSLEGLKKCEERAKDAGKYNGKPLSFWAAKVEEYENIIQSYK